MYESFYGLRENPFNVTPDPQYIYLGQNQKEALAHLLYGVRTKKGFIVLTGEVGTGKTTLVHYLLDKLNGKDRTKTAYLFNPKLTVNDFIEYILKDLGLDFPKGSKGDYLHILHQNLVTAYQEGESVILIVDEAQGLNPELLEEIRLLSNLETSKSKLLQIILVGQPELNKTLLEPGFRQLRQRVNLHYNLLPLSEQETKEYIEKRLRIAGAKGALFSKGAIKEIYLKSKGIPRLVNILCDNSLLIGYASGQKLVDGEKVREAARDLKIRSGYRRIWLWSFLIIFITAGALLALFFQKTGFLKGLLDHLHLVKENIIGGVQNIFNFFK